MVAAICNDLDVPHRTLCVILDSGNIQEQARNARYAALARWMEERGLAALATAHHLDDQAETLVMRLNRGSGLIGLAGVRRRTTVPGYRQILLRPLLDWRRLELEAIVHSAGLRAARDPSNVDERFDRVRIRSALAAAPWLDPQGLARSAALLAEAGAYVGGKIEEAWRECVTVKDGIYCYRASASDFEAVEVVWRIFLAAGRDARRGDVAKLVARLRKGQNASLGGLIAQPDREEKWRFSPEPARQSR